MASIRSLQNLADSGGPSSDASIYEQNMGSQGHERPPSRPSSQAGGGRQRRRHMYGANRRNQGLQTRPNTEVQVEENTEVQVEDALLNTLPAAVVHRTKVGASLEGGGGSTRSHRRRRTGSRRDRKRYNNVVGERSSSRRGNRRKQGGFSRNIVGDTGNPRTVVRNADGSSFHLPSQSDRFTKTRFSKQKVHLREERTIRGTSGAAIFNRALPNTGTNLKSRKSPLEFGKRPYSRNRESNFRQGRAQTSYALPSGNVYWKRRSRLKNMDNSTSKLSTLKTEVDTEIKNRLRNNVRPSTSWASELLNQKHKKQSIGNMRRINTIRNSSLSNAREQNRINPNPNSSLSNAREQNRINPNPNSSLSNAREENRMVSGNNGIGAESSPLLPANNLPSGFVDESIGIQSIGRKERRRRRRSRRSKNSSNTQNSGASLLQAKTITTKDTNNTNMVSFIEQERHGIIDDNFNEDIDNDLAHIIKKTKPKPNTKFPTIPQTEEFLSNLI